MVLADACVYMEHYGDGPLYHFPFRRFPLRCFSFRCFPLCHLPLCHFQAVYRLVTLTLILTLAHNPTLTHCVGLMGNGKIGNGKVGNSEMGSHECYCGGMAILTW